jgi:hypothetical protein
MFWAFLEKNVKKYQTVFMGNGLTGISVTGRPTKLNRDILFFSALHIKTELYLQRNGEIA